MPSGKFSGRLALDADSSTRGRSPTHLERSKFCHAGIRRIISEIRPLTRTDSFWVEGKARQIWSLFRLFELRADSSSGRAGQLERSPARLRITPQVTS